MGCEHGCEHVAPPLTAGTNRIQEAEERVEVEQIGGRGESGGGTIRRYRRQRREWCFMGLYEDCGVELCLATWD